MKNNKMILILLSLAILFSSSILFSSCSSNSGSSDNMKNEAVMDGGESYGFQNQESGLNGEAENSIAYDEQSIEFTNIGDPSLKIIKNGYLNIETKELNKALNIVTSKVNSVNGYVQNLNSDAKSISLVVRIPAEEFDGFMNVSSEFGNIVNKSISTEDISETYFDTEARIKSLKVQEERLLDLLSKGTELKYLLQVEEELTRVRTDIERLEGTMRNYENRISFSTVEINIYVTSDFTKVNEVPKTFGAKLVGMFKDGVYVVKGLLEGLILGLTYMLPIIVLLACVAFPLIKLIKMLKKKGIFDKKNSSNVKNSLPENENVDNEKPDNEKPDNENIE